MTAPTVATGRWELDPATSTARFVAHQLGRSVPGTIPFLSARCAVTADGNPEGVAAQLDLTAIDSGNARRDADLAKPGLLDTADHPVMTVDLADVVSTADGWAATAVIRARGAAAPVAVVITREPDDRTSSLTVRIQGRLDRRPLGIRTPRIAIGRWIDLDVTARFERCRS